MCAGSSERVPGQQYLADGQHGTRPVLRNLSASARSRLHQRQRHSSHGGPHLPRSGRLQPAEVLALQGGRDALWLATGKWDAQRQCIRSADAATCRLPLRLLLQGQSLYAASYRLYEFVELHSVQLSLAILPWVGAMSTCESRDVNRHTARCTSPVSVISQCKLVSGWGLRKWSSALWALWLRKDFIFLRIIVQPLFTESLMFWQSLLPFSKRRFMFATRCRYSLQQTTYEDTIKLVEPLLSSRFIELA